MQPDSNWRKDWFIDPSCVVYQNPKHFCFNTDSVLLAQFAKAHTNEKVLEIGCNNGAILLWIDRVSPGQLDGVEIQSESAALADFNLSRFAHSSWNIYRQDVKTLPSGNYDVILCNPPFFPLDSSMENQKLDLRQLGRFEVNLNLKELVQSASRQLKSNGRFYLVYRPERLAEVLHEFEMNNLALHRMAVAYDIRDNQPKSILLEGIKEGSCNVLMEEPIWIGKKD